MIHRMRRRKLTPRQENFRRYLDLAVNRADALAFGYGEMLKRCGDEAEFKGVLACLNGEVADAFREQTRADKAFEESLKRKPSKKAVAAA